MGMRDELAESPDVVERLLDAVRPAIDGLAGEIRARDIDVVVIAARGTSDHAAVYAQYVLGSRNGLVVAPATPSLSSVYHQPPSFEHALVLGISQSGRSPDVVAVLADARRQGALTAVLTNDPDSELAAATDCVIDLGAGPELAVAATKTYVAEVAAVAMLSATLAGHGDRDLADVAAAMRAALELEPTVRDAATVLVSARACVVLARGYHYATAREWALKLKELTGILADPYSSADFQHGPIAMVEEGLPMLGVTTTGPALDGMVELLERVRDRGGRLIVLSDDQAALGIGTGIAIPTVPEWLSPLVAIVPAQLFAYHLARARGLDPDAPRHLSKVTLTL